MNKKSPHDLFGEVPVTWPEVETWVFALVGLTRDSPRWQWYVNAWNVVDKIRRAKTAGDFDDIIMRELRPPPRFRMASHFPFWRNQARNAGIATNL